MWMVQKLWQLNKPHWTGLRSYLTLCRHTGKALDGWYLSQSTWKHSQTRTAEGQPTTEAIHTVRGALTTCQWKPLSLYRPVLLRDMVTVTVALAALLTFPVTAPASDDRSGHRASNKSCQNTSSDPSVFTSLLANKSAALLLFEVISSHSSWFKPLDELANNVKCFVFFLLQGFCSEKKHREHLKPL